MIITELDFAKKHSRQISLDELCTLAHDTGMSADRFYWIDTDQSSIHDLLAQAQSLSLNNLDTKMQADNDDVVINNRELRFVLSDVSYKNGAISLQPVPILLCRNLMITQDSGDRCMGSETGARFLCDMRDVFIDDFQGSARSPGYLLFEMADALVSGYERVLRKLGADNEAIQAELLGNAEDAAYSQTSFLLNQLLQLRKQAINTENVLDEMATRTTALVPESTQPFLAIKARRLEHIGLEIMQERELLMSNLNLNLSLTAQRTNRSMRRLTSVSMFFLPLSFLVGLYGMNFKRMPELSWEYGYGYFWLLAVSVGTVVLILLRRGRWF